MIWLKAFWPTLCVSGFEMRTGMEGLLSLPSGLRSSTSRLLLLFLGCPGGVGGLFEGSTFGSQSAGPLNSKDGGSMTDHGPKHATAQNPKKPLSCQDMAAFFRDWLRFDPEAAWASCLGAIQEWQSCGFGFRTLWFSGLGLRALDFSISRVYVSGEPYGPGSGVHRCQGLGGLEFRVQGFRSWHVGLLLRVKRLRSRMSCCAFRS